MNFISSYVVILLRRGVVILNRLSSDHIFILRVVNLSGVCRNDMTLSLNNSTTRNGHFTNDSGALWSAIGGPFFTILQGLIFLLLTRLTTSIYTYSIAFFAVFSRFFSIVFGGIDLQDEARIASLTNTNKYLVAAIVLAILFLILWRCNRIMKLNLKASSYFLVLGVFAILIVIEADKILK